MLATAAALGRARIYAVLKSVNRNGFPINNPLVQGIHVLYTKYITTEPCSLYTRPVMAGLKTL